ncbi:MAG TPA: LysE family translocator [Opitutaceae bacterium]|nr:LysE family translocator [Opitutaceae bacterium]
MLAQLAGLLGVLTLGLLSPGPDFFLILRNSLGLSAARGLGTAAGIALGLAVQVLAISLGFAALPPAAMRALQLAGAAYLAWLGLRALLCRAEPAAADASQAAHVPGAHSGFVDGLVCNLTNPKAFLFFVGLFAQVLPPGTSPGWRLALPVLIVVHGAVMWTLVVLALRAPPVATRLRRAQHWLPRAFGLVLLAFAVWLAWTTLAR